ncbi:hypothetical protein Goarm_005105 [Gossypium armourianum]|uniref:Uncharacterized protein n=1 Tax=Gossypium armourianum TaxID=34283 RepID=A0A7J9JZ37_9ROSI|nr:hypothetical protein [Gossypium armourianum]
MVLCKEIWPLIKYHRWELFRMIPKDNVVVPVVQEFYTSLRDQESRNTEGCMWDMASVSMTSTEHPLKPSRSIIGDTLFQKYIEVQAKQIKDWNKQQQEVTTTAASFQRLTQAQQEVGESSHPKLNWMIQWPPTDMEKDEEGQDSEEDKDDESEEMDFEEDD